MGLGSGLPSVHCKGHLRKLQDVRSSKTGLYLLVTHRKSVISDKGTRPEAQTGLTFVLHIPVNLQRMASLILCDFFKDQQSGIILNEYISSDNRSILPFSLTRCDLCVKLTLNRVTCRVNNHCITTD